VKNFYSNKKVIVTGHTGFKGSWLTSWLKLMKAEVTGISIDVPSNPNHFEVANICDGIEDCRIDIREIAALSKKILEIKPDFIFHLAAQPIVSLSYEDPLETWKTNLIGTINILESMKKLENKCSGVIITSDKCYDNVEWEWGYKETDSLGGSDPYSASKGAAEIAIKSYVNSFFSNQENLINISSARAGNVIGGGDWAENRIIPDCIKSWSNNKRVILRNPESTRPWQHVLEPIGGYLKLGALLSINPKLHGEAFNFGPLPKQNYSVLDLVKEMSLSWEKVSWEIMEEKDTNYYESSLLKLNCDKALHHLGWQSILNFKETVDLTVNWYKAFHENPDGIEKITTDQINFYSKKMKKLM
tara:strand:- start:10586 stop:11662 length:1077 start_codon:yes stop_codon:yes gene_type:complete